MITRISLVRCGQLFAGDLDLGASERGVRRFELCRLPWPTQPRPGHSGAAVAASRASGPVGGCCGGFMLPLAQPRR